MTTAIHTSLTSGTYASRRFSKIAPRWRESLLSMPHPTMRVITARSTPNRDLFAPLGRKDRQIHSGGLFLANFSDSGIVAPLWLFECDTRGAIQATAGHTTHLRL
jgi:hypothetical protein